MAILLVSELADYNLEDGLMSEKCNGCRPHSDGQYYILCSYHEGWVDGIDAKFAQMSKIMDQELGKTNVN
jgi:hypothetical protein